MLTPAGSASSSASTAEVTPCEECIRCIGRDEEVVELIPFKSMGLGLNQAELAIGIALQSTLFLFRLELTA